MRSWKLKVAKSPMILSKDSRNSILSCALCSFCFGFCLPVWISGWLRRNIYSSFLPCMFLFESLRCHCNRLGYLHLIYNNFYACLDHRYLVVRHQKMIKVKRKPPLVPYDFMSTSVSWQVDEIRWLTLSIVLYSFK